MVGSSSNPTAPASSFDRSADDYASAHVPDELKPVYLLVGTDRPKITRALQRLQARVGAAGVERLSATTATGEDVVGACNALGLFSGDRLVVVEDVDRWKAADTRAIAAYVTAPAPATVLALVGGDAAPEALAKACRRAGQILAYNVVKKRLPEWVADQFARLGVEAESDACHALVQLVGEDVGALASEAEKLATWAGEEPVTRRDVEALAATTTELPIFALTDAWGRRDVAGALEACETILERGSGARSAALSRLAASLAAHVGRVRNCQSLAAEGVRARDAAARLKMHPFAAEKAFAQAANFSAEELRTATVRLAELDLALKGGSKLSGDLELERTLVEITRPAERPARAGG